MDDTVLEAPFVLAPGVIVFAAEEADPSVRRQLDLRGGELVISRPGHRAFSKVLDAAAGELVLSFREPTPIPSAIRSFAERHALTPADVLREGFPLLLHLSRAALLVPASTVDVDAPSGTLPPGTGMGGLVIVELLRSLADSEVYRARAADGGVAALKVARVSGLDDAFAREREILGRVGGTLAPELLGHGRLGDRPWLATRWIAGVPVDDRARQLRLAGGPENRRRLQSLAEHVARAYAALHVHGFLHGDVHAPNVLVDAHDRVWLVDFGLGNFVDPAHPSRHIARSASVWTMDPALAGALLSGELPSPPTPADEQYSVAALLYALLAGTSHLPFAPDADTMLRAVGGPVPPFAVLGAMAWPSVEAALRRALAPKPEDRFPSVEGLAEALVGASIPPDPGGPFAASIPEELLVADGTPLLRVLPPPLAPLHYGAAGFAWVLTRAAQIREDADVLHSAERWSRHAVAALASVQGLDFGPLGVVPGTVGPAALTYGASGVHYTHALTCLAAGDPPGFAAAALASASTPFDPEAPIELLLGLSGQLLARASLLEAARAVPRLDPSVLETHVTTLASQLLQRVAALPAIGRGGLAHLGMAHGWAGVLYALLRSADALHASPDDQLARRLEELGAFAVRTGVAAAFPGTVGGTDGTRTPDGAAGWCAGTAGHVPLWLLAAAATGEGRYRDLAIAAGRHTAGMLDAPGQLCCGLAGQGFALLALYRATGDKEWLALARRLSERAGAWSAVEDGRPWSLFRGRLGPLALALELERPEQACFPVFGAIGWPDLRGR